MSEQPSSGQGPRIRQNRSSGSQTPTSGLVGALKERGSKRSAEPEDVTDRYDNRFYLPLELVTDRRLTQPANGSLRSRLAFQLQSRIGNRALQRLVAKDSLSHEPVQRVLTAAEPSTPDKMHLDSPQESTVHKSTEAVTNQSGTDSETGNFQHANKSEFLDRHPVTFGGYKIADIVTRGGDNNTVVKMHLVNSYLHPNANDWGSNWVYGSQQLNADHKTAEALAKEAHPKSPDGSLNYETEATGGAPTIYGTQTDLNDKILTIIQNKLGHLYTSPADLGAVKIGNDDVGTFWQNWSDGIKTATSEVTVRYRTAQGGVWGATQTEPIPDSNPGSGFYPYPAEVGNLDSGRLHIVYLANGGTSPPEEEGPRKSSRKRAVDEGAEGSGGKKPKPGPSE